MTPAEPSTNMLDAIVVIMVLLIVGGGVAALAFVSVPRENLPILASLLTGVLGIVAAYGAFRWGSSVAAKAAAQKADQ